MPATLPEVQASPHFSADYAACVHGLIQVVERRGQPELSSALRLFLAEGADELAEDEIRAAIFGDWCRYRREVDRMLEAIARIIAEALAKAQVAMAD